jgi:group I intron endonuclease
MIIYRITNTVNGHFYIGKTTLTIEERFKKHYYNHKTLQTHLYRAMRKYGFDSFIIEELASNVKHLDEEETKYIAELNPHYNMTSGGDGGDTSSSPNFIKAMKEYHAKRTPESYATYGMLGKTSPIKGKKIVDSKCKPVSCDGLIFESIELAQDHFKGISVRKRLASDKYPNFYRL